MYYRESGDRYINCEKDGIMLPYMIWAAVKKTCRSPHKK